MAQADAHEDALHLFGHESHKGKDSELKGLAHEAMPKPRGHITMAFELAGEKKEHEKLHKVREYAKEVMEGK